MKQGSVKNAEKNLLPTSIVRQSTVDGSVVENTLQMFELKGIEILKEDICNVYDLEVEDMHEFFANGVLVHNCIDAARYYVLGELLGKIKVKKDLSGIFTI